MALKFQLNLSGGVATQYASIFIYILSYNTVLCSWFHLPSYHQSS